MNIKPVGDQVLVKIDVHEEKTACGLFLPVPAEPTAKNTGVVLAIGDSDVIEVKVGDHVLMDKSLGRRFSIPIQVKDKNGFVSTKQEEHTLISYYDILALLED